MHAIFIFIGQFWNGVSIVTVNFKAAQCSECSVKLIHELCFIIIDLLKASIVYKKKSIWRINRKVS